MATYRVGQRVRVIRSIWGYEGMEATVVGVMRTARHTPPYDGYPISIDGIGELAPNRKTLIAPPDAIEPIQPERNQIIPWSECLWMPEHHKLECLKKESA